MMSGTRTPYYDACGLLRTSQEERMDTLKSDMTVENNNQTSAESARPAFHGSDIEKVCMYYHLKKEHVVNFGANVNPLGLSKKVQEDAALHLDLFSSYPDRTYTDLRNAVSEYCGIPADYVLPGNGSSELISLLIETRQPKKTLILGPTYSEYSRELSFSGSTQEYYHLKEEDDFNVNKEELCHSLEDGYDFLILCNPNNPTSSAIKKGDMEDILSFCHERNIFVMVDETYAEFAPSVEEVTAIPLAEKFDNLMVLRGVSKFFAAPGMRLGYGITGNMDFLKKMREKQIPWSLNSLGAYAGTLMLRDTDYIGRTRQLILSERDRMYQRISQLPTFKTYPPYGNFLLLRIMKEGLTASDVFEKCIRHGLMIRDCSSFQCLEGEYVRFCIMMPEDNTRLLGVLSSM